MSISSFLPLFPAYQSKVTYGNRKNFRKWNCYGVDITGPVTVDCRSIMVIPFGYQCELATTIWPVQSMDLGLYCSTFIRNYSCPTVVVCKETWNFDLTTWSQNEFFPFIFAIFVHKSIFLWPLQLPSIGHNHHIARDHLPQHMLWDGVNPLGQADQPLADPTVN